MIFCKTFFEIFRPKTAKNGPTIKFFKIYGKPTGGIFLIFLMKSQKHKGLKLTVKTLSGELYTGDFGKKRAHGFKTYADIVSYNNIKVNNCVK